MKSNHYHNTFSAIYLYYTYVYNGSKKCGATSVITVDDISGIEIGHLVTVNCENYTQETVIGQCTQISENTVGRVLNA